MTNGHSRFAEILNEYASAMADIEQPMPTKQFDDDRRVLRPADQQRACKHAKKRVVHYACRHPAAAETLELRSPT
jgi:hypothetical protein